MNVFVFDIETVPDVDGGRRLFGLEGLGDEDVARVMAQRRRQETGGSSEFLRHHLHRIVAIAVAMRSGERFKVWSLGDPAADERELLERFYDGVSRFSPVLVSWNGSGFDLPVLHYRALLHGVGAARYWETEEREFRYNNYLGRFHWRHIDLMDVLAGYQPRAHASLQDIATLLGLPGKGGMDGSRVWEAYRAGRNEEIRAYCESDVLNTYLVFLRFELMRGRLSPPAYARECALVRETLEQSGVSHLQRFAEAWRERPVAGAPA